ncbi:hypothetical protein [Geminicoccus harenae]|uniref:hypothetical protein n=2 Tax=Geminicoccus harenae TaxID=2498453 RepID=UPI001C94948C|nr:hypothetical protein [Geminicoccus harenae]
MVHVACRIFRLILPCPSRASTGAMALCLSWILLAATGALAADRPDLRRWPGEIDVMTQNQYPGGDVEGLLDAAAAGDPGEAAVALLRQVAENYFPRRAERQAAEIVRRRADLVALQEVYRLTCQDLPPVPGACRDPAIARAFGDQLDATLATLRDRGADYRVAASVIDLDLREIETALPGVGRLRGIPFTIDGKRGLLGGYGRNVILRQVGVETRPLEFAGCLRSEDGCRYRADPPRPLPGLGKAARLTARHGFVGVETTIRGRSFRFVTTRLARGTEHAPAQAAELVAALAAASGPATSPVILAGEFSEGPDAYGRAPEGSAYQVLTGAGLVDAWKLRYGSLPGTTCCQSANLRNPQSELAQRVDLIFVQEPIQPRQLRVVGAEAASRTWPLDGWRLWPSDHAGVSARLGLNVALPAAE